MAKYKMAWSSMPDWALLWLEQEGISLPDKFTEEEFEAAAKGKEATLYELGVIGTLWKAGLITVSIEEGEIRIRKA